MTVLIERDQWKRPLLPDPTNGRKRAWTRVTTMANTIADRYALEKWNQRNLVRGMAVREDLLVRAAAAGDDKDELTAVVDAALEAAQATSAADTGTALHRITERLDRGEDVTVPKDYQGDVEAYTTSMTDNGIKVLDGWIERIVIAPDLECAGTPDRLVTCPSSDLAVVWDLKTGANALRYSLVDISAQLAIYAAATHYYDGKLHEMPAVEQDFALMCHLPAGSGTATIYSVDLQVGRAVAKLCTQVRAWRKAENVAKAYMPGVTDTGIRQRVTNIKTYLDGGALPVDWPEGIATPSRHPEPYTALEASLVQNWCEQVEDALNIPPF